MFDEMVLKLVRTLHHQPRNLVTSSIKLSKTIQHLKTLKSFLIVSGLVHYKLIISAFIDQCFNLGSPQLALSAFYISTNRGLLLQNLLLRRFCNLGLYQNVIFVFRSCRLLGDFTFPYVINACAARKDVKLGREVHCVVLRNGYGWNFVVETALVDFYAKIGRMDVARQVFDEMSEWDLVSWNTLISGYSLNGCDYEALDAFFHIWVKCVKPNVSTLASIIPVCTRLRFLNLGKSLHCYTVKCGYNRNELLIPTLISMHANDGDISAAHRLFEFSPTKSSVIWNSMIYAYTHNQNPEQAFEMFSEMIRADLHPNLVTFVSVIPCCEKIDSISHGKCLHGCAIKYGLDYHVSVATCFISMYAKLVEIGSSLRIFTSMPQKNHLTWNSVISGYVHNGLFDTSLDAVREMQLVGFEPDPVSIINVLSACSELESLRLGKSAHAISIRKGFDSNINVSNLLLTFYSKCDHHLNSSFELFNRTTNKNTISWNTIISGCVFNGEIENATALFFKMQQECVQMDIVTLISILPGFDEARYLLQGMTLHGFALKFGFSSDITLTNCLISMYCSCKDVDSGALIFHGVKTQSLVSWNSLITGYRWNNLNDEVIYLFRKLVGDDLKPNYITLLNILPACRTLSQGESVHAYAIRTRAILQTPLRTSVISMYSRFKNLDSCLAVFKSEGKSNISLWNSMMSALVEAREAHKAFSLFRQLLQTGLNFDSLTILSLISACVVINNMYATNSMMAFAIKAGFFSETSVCNALLDLYAKCGDISMAREIFDGLINKDSISWGVMINGYGLNGDSETAILLLSQMEKTAVFPDAVTYLSVLSACSHGGSTEESMSIFNSMILHGIKPTMEHYGCILDLLGRTGRLNEAYDIIQRFPEGPSSSILESLLGACRVHGNAELGGKIGKLIIEKDPGNSRVYVMVHNIYAGVERWEDADNIRREIEERQLRKVPGFSLL